MPRRLRFACLFLLSLVLPALQAHAASPVLLLDARALGDSQRQVAASLQGLANRAPEGPRVFLLTRPSDDTWLAYTLRMDPRPVQSVTLQELLAEVKPLLKGQVLYDPARPYTLDVATTAAGLKDAVLSDTDLGLVTLFDFRTRWASAAEAYAWEMATLAPQANRRQVALLSADGAAMRDYAIQQKMVTVSPAAGLQPEGWQDLFLHLQAGTAFYGDYAEELLPMLSEASHYLVPAAETANLSFYSMLPQGTRSYQYPGHVEPVAPRYLALIFDCSDLDTAVDRMPDLWENRARGTLPLGWALPAALASAAPPVVRRYYAEAYHSGTDQFVLGPSGAGFTDLSRSTAPDAFFRATARAVEALDLHTALYQAAGAPDAFGRQVSQLAAEGGVDGGVFLLTRYDQPPAIYNGVPALTTPYVDSVEQAVTYLNRIPIDRRFAAICLNAATMTPEDAAHLAAHVSSRYVVVTPSEIMSLIRSVANGESKEDSPVTVTAAEHPEGEILPTAPVPINVEIQPQDHVASASVVYRPAGGRLGFDQPLTASDGVFRAHLPPLLWGGDQELKVRVVDTSGRVAWSPTWTIQVARADQDEDGLSDAEEAFLLTDPAQADTDGDGLTDPNDQRPLALDWKPARYFGPIYPPSDIPYLTNPEGSEVVSGGRVLPPGQRAHYWMPTLHLPSGAPAVVRLEGEGPAQVSLGQEPAALSPRFQGDLEGVWQSEAFRMEAGRSTVYLEVTCPADAKTPLTIYSAALSSAAEAPSVAHVYRTPNAPGPDQPIIVSALAFSPREVTGATLTFRLNGRGQVTMPMTGPAPYYSATIPAQANRTRIEYWVAAQDAQGGQTASVPEEVVVGGRGREVISLLARRSFLGPWRPSPEWNDAASYAPEPGLTDTAPANLTGGNYAVWVLAAGRGNGLAVSVGDKRVGAIDPNKPDGWQQVGRVRLEAGKHRVSVTAEQPVAEAPWTDPRYAAVVLSTDTTFAPPADQVVGTRNSLVLLSPPVDEPLSGVVELHATGAGNLTALEFSLDGTRLRRVTGPPFSLVLSTTRYANGPHTLRLETVDRTGPTGMVLDVPITIAN